MIRGGRRGAGAAATGKQQARLVPSAEGLHKALGDRLRAGARVRRARQVEVRPNERVADELRDEAADGGSGTERKILLGLLQQLVGAQHRPDGAVRGNRGGHRGGRRGTAVGIG